MPATLPDQHALNIARAIQQEVAPDTVVLFGSRATGQHRPDSDVDILVIKPDQDPGSGTAWEAARNFMAANPPELEVNIIAMTISEFQRNRRAKQHLAGQADHYGVVMSDEKLNYTTQCDDDYPDHWEANRQRLENAAEWSKEFNDMVDNGHWNQKVLGFAAQQAIENVFRGLLSAYNDPAVFRYDLNRIWNHYTANHYDPNHRNAALAYAAANELLDCTTYESAESSTGYQNWLTQYASEYRYNRAPRPMDSYEKREIQQLVNRAVDCITGLIHELSGTSENDLFPDGVPWD